jgi:hypothetical protein
VPGVRDQGQCPAGHRPLSTQDAAAPRGGGAQRVGRRDERRCGGARLRPWRADTPALGRPERTPRGSISRT